MQPQILVCDDEVHILRATEFKLRRAGYDVVTASDGEQAWETIQARCPDLLITDYQMPRLTGSELIQRLRASDDTRDLPVILLTGKEMELSREVVLEQWGVLAMLGKPFSPRELLQIVQNAVSVSGGESLECSAL
ncbi:MAG: response regulator [Planctomycetes bacterium]|nr:response regulator [Planctomycetota bacterium]